LIVNWKQRAARKTGIATPPLGDAILIPVFFPVTGTPRQCFVINPWLVTGTKSLSSSLFISDAIQYCGAAGDCAVGSAILIQVFFQLGTGVPAQPGGEITA